MVGYLRETFCPEQSQNTRAINSQASKCASKYHDQITSKHDGGRYHDLYWFKCSTFVQKRSIVANIRASIWLRASKHCEPLGVTFECSLHVRYFFLRPFDLCLVGETDAVVVRVKDGDGVLQPRVTSDPGVQAQIGTSDRQDTLARVGSTKRSGGGTQSLGVAAVLEGDLGRRVAVVVGVGGAVLGEGRQAKLVEEALSLAGGGDDDGCAGVNDGLDGLAVDGGGDLPEALVRVNADVDRGGGVLGRVGSTEEERRAGSAKVELELARGDGTSLLQAVEVRKVIGAESSELRESHTRDTDGALGRVDELVVRNTNSSVGSAQTTDVNHISVDGTLSSGTVTVSGGESVTVGLGSRRSRRVVSTVVDKGVRGTSVKVDREALSRSAKGNGTSPKLTLLLVGQAYGASSALDELGRNIALQRVSLARVLLVVGEVLGVLGAKTLDVSVDLGPVDLVGAGDVESGALLNVNVETTLLLLLERSGGDERRSGDETSDEGELELHFV